MKTKDPKVIIFTMAYNAQNTIERTIKSILDQTYTNFQYFILDNAATDNTGKIIAEYSQKDSRIIPLRVNKNDPLNGGAFFHALVHATDAKYIVWCDADDAYVSTFLDETVRFAEDNQLDLVACGYDKIDGLTGQVLKRKELNENLILHDNLFAEKYVQYRGFKIFVWGKLYSISALRASRLTGTVNEECICNDSMWITLVFQSAKRVGIFGKSMYRYYQYPHSLSNTNVEISIDSYWEMWQTEKEYISAFGPISKVNEDFLYAINLSLVDEIVEKIFACECETEKRLNMLYQVFSRESWKETLERNADPQFQNLAARKQYESTVKGKILALPEIENYMQKKEQLFYCLEGR